MPNIVTFLTFMADGRLQLQRRSFVAPNGKAIGNPGKDSINGGAIKDGESQIDALLREAEEELGVDITGAFEYVGDVSDPTHKRTNHVYRVDGYDTLLKQLSVEEAVEALTNPEGIGRNFLDKANLNALIQEGLLTDISVKILKELFPELLEE